MDNRGDPLADCGGWPAIIDDLVGGRDLTTEVARAAVEVILNGDADPAVVSAFLVGMRAKGENPTEIAAMLDAVDAAALTVHLPTEIVDTAIDVVGTGGDGSDSVNVSTMAALVAAGAGAPVCKHGNRSSSSRCGTADVLAELGLVIELTPEQVSACVQRVGFGFCLAPAFHPAFRHVGPTRRALGVRTVFNLLGPMANPARVRRQLIGVADPSVAGVMVDTLEQRGTIHAWVVHGGGMDELTTTAPSHVTELRDGQRRDFSIDPAALGLAPATMDDLRGGDPAENAAAVRTVLDGQPGPHRDIVVLNAGAALVVAGICDDITAGIAAASAAIDDGRAANILAAAVAFTGELRT